MSCDGAQLPVSAFPISLGSADLRDVCLAFSHCCIRFVFVLGTEVACNVMIYTSRLAVSPGCDNTNLAGVACQDSDAKDEVLGAPHLSHSCHMDCKIIVRIHSHLTDLVILTHDIFKLAVSPPSKKSSDLNLGWFRTCGLSDYSNQSIKSTSAIDGASSD